MRFIIQMCKLVISTFLNKSFKRFVIKNWERRVESAMFIAFIRVGNFNVVCYRMKTCCSFSILLTTQFQLKEPDSTFLVIREAAQPPPLEDVPPPHAMAND